MLTRFDPFRDLDQLFEQMSSTATQSTRGMPLDIARGKNGYRVIADLPGVDPSSIDISVEGNVLMLRAARHENEFADMQVLSRERSGGTFVRQLTVGDGFDLDEVEAHYDNGVLTVNLPVAESAKPRRISVSNRPKNDAIETTSKQSVTTGEQT